MTATNWTNQTTNNTSWSKQSIGSTSFNGREITNLGAIMDDTVYLMDDTVCTMDDMKLNGYAPATQWAKQ